MTNYDIKQITNKSIFEKTVDKNGITYGVLDFSKTPLIKIGYCCELKFSKYPIFINDTQININPVTGMYEVQSEEIFEEDNLEKTAKIQIVKIEVPIKNNLTDINFTLDYIPDRA